jgi:hypothetical protein
MGIRIEMYAVDLPPFNRLLENRLGEVLRLYADHGTSEYSLRYFGDGTESDYCAQPKKGVFWLTRKAQRVADGELPAELNRRLGDVLEGGTTYFLAGVLQALSSVPAIEWIEEITSDHRRWWIGSLFDYLECSSRFPKQDVLRLTALFQIVLRGRDCGKPMLRHEVNVADFAFPVHPQDDPDFSMGVWTGDEAAFVVDLFRRVKDQNPQFRQPPGPIGFAPTTDVGWNEWVNEMMEQILAIGRLAFEEMRIITFIG